MRVWSNLKSLVSGGNTELGTPDLSRKVVDGILRLKRHAGKGMVVLPHEVEVQIQVGDGSVHIIQQFVEDPAFDRDLDIALRNRLVKSGNLMMPVRRYSVSASDRTSVEVRETPSHGFRLRVIGGDRDGALLTLPRDRQDLLIGRGAWHGDDQQLANDIIVCEGDRSVSRRAARLHRLGAAFELQSVDQREAVAVVREDGQRMRPALSATGRVKIRPGENIEFTDGTAVVVTLKLEEAK